ncbi:hypothetical protein E2C01_080748 [Portunus trituberculatus]|uniref:Uncharacterized protein n=1 Tax=Portunus trituberculatus TaxID=210409 RepID=A0A5B7IQ61_PORTR|nr:hypothetical protein [Portunus trituberculatus]
MMVVVVVVSEMRRDEAPLCGD